jgi:hypothetical protein
MTAIAGVWFIAVAGMGYSFRPLRRLERLLYGAIGVFLLLPVEVSDVAKWLNIAGVCIGAALLAWERAIWQRSGRTIEAPRPAAVGDLTTPNASHPAQPLPPFSSLD